MKNVAVQLGDEDLNVWKYNEEKCVSWLLQRVDAVKKARRLGLGINES